MLDSICDCLIKAKKNSEVKAVLLTNNGDFFCSGIDYSELMNCIDDKEYRALVYELISGIRYTAFFSFHSLLFFIATKFEQTFELPQK